MSPPQAGEEESAMSKLQEDIQATAHNFTLSLQGKLERPLDYSPESLEMVEELLEALSQEELDEEALFNLSSMAGCYVFETARRSYGGEYFWLEEERQPVLAAGLPDFSVGIKAWEKVRGRLLNGKEDSIPFYIAGYQEHIAIGRNRKGYRVTIV